MGCITSKNAASPETADATTATGVTTAPKENSAVPAAAPEYKVMVFALMRNTHEGLRGWLKTAEADAAAAAATGETRDAALCTKAQESLDILLQLIAVHMEQEEKVFFNVLDESFDQVATKEGLRDEHKDDLEMQANLKSAAAKIGQADSTAADHEAYAKAMSEFVFDHVKHLEHEESVMMPLMSKIEPASRRPVIVHDILTCNWEAHKDVLVPRVVEQMAVRNPYPSLRMFLAAAQRCMTKEQYAYVLPAVKEAAGDVWAKLEAHGLGGPGQFVK